MLEEFNSVKSIQKNTCTVTISSCMRNQILQFYQPISNNNCGNMLAQFFRKCSRKNYQNLELPDFLENQWHNNFVDNKLNFTLDFSPVQIEYIKIYNVIKQIQQNSQVVDIDPHNDGFKVYHHKDRYNFKKLVILFLDFHQSPLQFQYLINYYAQNQIQLIIPDIQQLFKISLKHLKVSFIQELLRNIIIFVKQFSSDFSVICHGASSFLGCYLKNNKFFTGKLILLNPILNVVTPQKTENRGQASPHMQEIDESFSAHSVSAHSSNPQSQLSRLQDLDSFGNSYISEAEKPKQFTIRVQPVVKLRTETFIANLQQNDIDMIIDEENEMVQLIETIDEVIQLVYQEKDILQLFGKVQYKPRKSLEEFQGITNFFRPLKYQIQELKSSLPLMLVMCNARLVQNYMDNMPQYRSFYKQIINFLFISRQEVTLPQNTIILVGSHNRFLNNSLLRKIYVYDKVVTRTVLGVGYDMLMAAFQTVTSFI